MKKKLIVTVNGNHFANNAAFPPDSGNEKTLNWQIAEFKALVKSKEMVKLIKVLEWILDKNPRFKAVYKKFKSLPINTEALGVDIIKMISFVAIPEHIKGRVIKETYPALAKKIKKLKG